MSIAELLHRVLTAPVAVAGVDTTQTWWSRYRDATGGLADPFDRAVVGGAIADRVGYAFAGGYQEAIRRLVPGLSPDALVSLCISEEGGAHPRAIHATRTGGRLRGRKQWATLAPAADVLLVAFTEGVDDAGRSRLRVAAVDARAGGVTIEPMPDTPFVPEIGHGVVALDGVAVADDAVLAGDGYADYIKPFRTAEDTHVHGALLGYVVQVARAHDWPPAVVAELCAAVAAMRSLATGDLRSPALHVAVAGALAATAQILSRSAEHWSRVDPEARRRWLRDSALLQVAANARQRRFEVAWNHLAG